MSHMTRVNTTLKNSRLLVKALKNTGARIQVYPAAREYCDLAQQQTAEKAAVETIAVDGYLNFRLQNDGTYQLQGEDYRVDTQWLDRLYQNYAKLNVLEKLNELGFMIEQEVEEKNEIIIEATCM